MNHADQYFEPADRTRAKIVAAVGEVERLLQGSSGAADSALRQSWSALVKLLDLRPPAPTRICPHCRGLGMRAATRCGTCWTLLDPLADEAIPTSVAGGLSDF